VIPIVSTVGCSNSDKASYLKQSVPELMSLGFRIYVVKQDVHGFEKDMPREDTRQLKRADTSVVLTSSQTFLDTRLTLIFPKGTAILQNTTTFCFLRNTNTG
jgi:molybdopterin-guanine dinucleotide biosynthesis protein